MFCVSLFLKFLRYDSAFPYVSKGFTRIPRQGKKKYITDKKLIVKKTYFNQLFLVECIHKQILHKIAIMTLLYKGIVLLILYNDIIMACNN